MRRTAETDAIDLALGIPGFDPDPKLVEHLRAALDLGLHQYADPAGSPLLRAALSRWLEHSREITVSADDITVTCGGTEALLLALRAVVEPGDDVVILEPTYEGFAGAAAACAAGVRRVRLEPPDWRLDVSALEASFTPSTKALVINTPHNPTGTIFNRQELAQIGLLCANRGVFCISDEVYEAFGGGAHISALQVPGLRERALAVGSFSKTLAVSGWRVGYLITPRELTQRVRQLHQATTAGAPSAAQDAIGRLVSAPEAYEFIRANIAAHVAEQGRRATSMFAGPNVRPLPGQGGCFFVAQLRAEPASEFCARLIEQYGVAVAPGTAFWSEPEVGSRYVRVAFNKADATMTDAARRLTSLHAAARASGSGAR